MPNQDPNNAGGATDGGVKPSWMSSLPDDLKQNETLAQYQSIGEAGKALVSYKQSEGKSIAIPDKDADESSWREFYSKIGRPSKMEDYNIAKPGDLPEDIPYRPEIEPVFKKFAYDNGLTSKQAEAAFTWYYDLVKQGHQQEQQRLAKTQSESEAKLKQEWGDNYDKNREVAMRTFTHYGKNGAVSSLLTEARINGVRLGDYPEFVKLFYEIGNTTLDDKVMAGSKSGMSNDVSDEATAKKMFPSMK